MSEKPTYEELEQRIKELKREADSHKLVEEALRESETLHRTLAQYSQTGIYIHIGGLVKFVNNSFAEILGYTPEEIVGRQYWEFVHPGDREMVKKISLDRARGDAAPAEYEFRHLSKDGKTVWVHNLPSIIQYQGQTANMGNLAYINERKQAEAVLQESQSKLLRAQYIARLGDFTWDISSGAVTWSEGMHKLLKYDLNEKIDYAKVNSIIHHPGDLESVTQWLNDSIVSGKERISPKEYRLVCKDGEILEVHTEGRIEYKGGEAVKLFGTCQDISERKGAEQALQNNQNFLNRIIEQSPFATWISDEKGTMIKCNAALKNLLNITDEQLIGKYNVFEDEVAIEQGEMPKIRTVFEDGKTVNLSAEWDGNKLGYKDAKKVHIEGTMFPIHDDKGNLTNVVNHWIDVTERKQAEEALRVSEEKYRRIFENIQDVYYESSLEGTILEISPSIENVSQYKRKDLIGRSLYDIYTNPEERDGLLKLILDKGKVNEFEMSLTDKDGSRHPCSITTLLVKDEQNNPVKLVGSMRDISERKQNEEERKKLKAQLQQAQKMEAMGTLAGGIAHDFNNLLMAIQGRASIMLMNKASSHPDIRHLKGMEDNVESAADLTRQLLGFARGGKYEVKPTDLNELVKKQNRMFGRTKKQITIRGKYEKDVWSVEVDQGQIDQVLLNLYVNAWQAMPAGGVLYLETENVTLDENDVRPFSIEPGEYVKISVTDTGVGMDRATREKIFDPFFTTKEIGRGTGLGLASAHGIIKNHSGFINVYSEKGHGTTFNIYLPASEKEAIEERKPAGDTLRGSETVLFVDDEDMIIEVAGELFEQLGYNVLTAKNGKEAIELYEENKEHIDIVLLDMIMPDMSGSDTYDKMRKINPDIKVLLSSGYSINGQATEIMDRGCNGFIQKPFKMKELSQKLREILDEK